MLDTIAALESLGIRVISGAHRLTAGLSLGHTVCARMDGGDYCVFSLSAEGQLSVYTTSAPEGIQAGVIVCQAGTGDRPAAADDTTANRMIFDDETVFSNSTGKSSCTTMVLAPSGLGSSDRIALDKLRASFQQISNIRKRDPFTPAIRSVGEKARLRSQRQQAMVRGK